MKHDICYRNVCLSACLSLCQTREPRLNGSRYWMHFTPYDWVMFLVSLAKFRNREFRASPRTSASKIGTFLSRAKIRSIIRFIYLGNSARMANWWISLLLFRHWRSHTRFRLVPKLMTLKLNDCERIMVVILRYFSEFGSFWANYITMVEVKFIFSKQKCSPDNLVFGNTVHMIYGYILIEYWERVC